MDQGQFVIQDELVDHTLRLIERDDSKALRKTVWTRMDGNALAFEWWTRSEPTAEWEKAAGFAFRPDDGGEP